MRILDATASVRTIWYQKNNPFTTFMDMRCGVFSCTTENMKHSVIKKIGDYKIYPDIIAVWQHVPFKDESFDMVMFDPPHIFKNNGQKLPGIANKYGVFYNQSWRQEISAGVIELFRVLKSEGVFVLKWNESQVKVDEVLRLMPYPPLFGTRTGQHNNTHWITFIKSRSKTLIDFTALEDA